MQPREPPLSITIAEAAKPAREARADGRGMKRTTTGILALAALSLPAEGAELGTFTDWIAHAEGSGKSRVCWAFSEPKKDEGKYTKRGRIHAVVSHRPGDKAVNQVMFTAGYVHRKDSAVSVTIGGRTFELFTEKDSSWTSSRKDDDALVAAMRAGNRMIVTGVSSRGTKTRDTYSLRGFSAAHKAISRACKVK